MSQFEYSWEPTGADQIELPELDLSQCENYDDEGVRCHHRGKYYAYVQLYLCLDCAEVYGVNTYDYDCDTSKRRGSL